MILKPKRGMTVVFKPPYNAYSRFCRQNQVSGQVGRLEAWNGMQARVLFSLQGRQRVNVNVDYIYDPTAPEHPVLAHTLFSDEE